MDGDTASAQTIVLTPDGGRQTVLTPAGTTQITIINNTGSTVHGVALNLPDARFTTLDSAAFGGDLGLFLPDTSFTTLDGMPPSEITSLKSIPPGGTITGHVTIGGSAGNTALEVVPNLVRFASPSTAPVSLASGDGNWTITPPSDATLAISEPMAVGLEPVLKITIDLSKLGTDTIKFMAPPTPSQVDSVGFNVDVEVDLVNNTGGTLSNLVMSLSNDDPALPYNLVPPSIHYGIALEPRDPSYAFLANASGFGGNLRFSDPSGRLTDDLTGAAANTMMAAPMVAPGGSTSATMTIHNTELADHNNGFSLAIATS